jgi:DNA-binding XRE family transcriptional regulator
MQNSARRHVVAEVRLECGLTQAGLAELIGYHTMSLQKIEQGTTKMSTPIAASLSKVFDLDPSWLLANDPEVPPITRTGAPWLREHYELARMDSTAWGLIAQRGPLPKSEENTALLAKMKQLYQAWQEEEFSARIAALLTHAETPEEGSHPDKLPRWATRGVILHRLKKFFDSLEDEFELDWKTMESRQERIDKYRLPYLELVEQVKKDTKAQLSPKPKTKAAGQKK